MTTANRPMSRGVLVTGFEPFGGAAVNPSAELALAWDGRVVRRRRVHGVVLPCVFGEAREALKRAMRRVRPELVICLGLAEGRRAFTPERVAINLDDACIPDNAGRQPVDARIEPRGPAAYWSTLPVKAIAAAVRELGLPAEVSHSAGTFVCNHIFYSLMHSLRRRPEVPGGFIHVPASTAMKQDGWTQGDLERALAVTVEVALTRKRDLRTSAGPVA